MSPPTKRQPLRPNTPPVPRIGFGVDALSQIGREGSFSRRSQGTPKRTHALERFRYPPVTSKYPRFLVGVCGKTWVSMANTSFSVEGGQIVPHLEVTGVNFGLFLTPRDRKKKIRLRARRFAQFVSPPLAASGSGHAPQQRSSSVRCWREAGWREGCKISGWEVQVAMGFSKSKSDLAPSEHPIQSPLKSVLKWVVHSPTPKWDPIGFDPQPSGLTCGVETKSRQKQPHHRN